MSRKLPGPLSVLQISVVAGEELVSRDRISLLPVENPCFSELRAFVVLLLSFCYYF